jgi:hypothetical protein
MNNSPRQQGPTVEVVEEKTSADGWVTTTIMTIAIIPALFALFFHLGAAYMSYQRNQSGGWAVLHFFFAVFYYPYYAFFQAGKPVETPMTESTSSLLPTSVQSAGRRLKKMLSSKRK